MTVNPEPITKQESLALDSAAELSPAKLNEAVDKRLAFVTSNLALVASITTGFGLFADGGGQLRSSDGLKWALGLLLTAVVVSLVGSMPNWFHTVNVNSPDEITDYFKKRRRWRAGAARLSILLFVIAVAVTAATVWDIASDKADPAPSIVLQVANGDKLAGEGSLEVAGLEAGAEVTGMLLGCPAPTETTSKCPDDAVIAVGSAHADSTGKATLKVQVTSIPPAVKLLEFRVSGAIQDSTSVVVPNLAIEPTAVASGSTPAVPAPSTN